MRNPDVNDVGCPSCDYGLPTACTCEEHPACTCGLHNDRETACTCGGRYRSAASTLFDVPAVKEALWLLLGGGLDEEGKEKWLTSNLERGLTEEAIFTLALATVNGMVAT
jgi:hypothetical protein